MAATGRRSSIEGNGVEAGRMHIATMHLARAFARTAVESGVPL